MEFPPIDTYEGDHVWSAYSLECDAKLVAAFVGECHVDDDQTSRVQLDHVHNDIVSCEYVVRVRVPDEAPLRILTWGQISPEGLKIHCYPEDRPSQFRLTEETPSFDLTEDHRRTGEISAQIGQVDLIGKGECLVEGNLRLVYLEGERLDRPVTRFNKNYRIKIARAPSDS